MRGGDAHRWTGVRKSFVEGDACEMSLDVRYMLNWEDEAGILVLGPPRKSEKLGVCGQAAKSEARHVF